ncbi:MAG: hypothetical protein FRX49_02975 [Trebouxia sp. A1-2]|nr:MAG: hypothetical protein FRX49_02975 [Trebouxia sp. A1-2]
MLGVDVNVFIAVPATQQTGVQAAQTVSAFTLYLLDAYGSESTAGQLTCAAPIPSCKSNIGFQLAGSSLTMAQGRMLNHALSLPFLLRRSGGLRRLPCRVLSHEQRLRRVFVHTQAALQPVAGNPSCYMVGDGGVQLGRPQG